MSVDHAAVSSEYFTVLGLDLVSGRGFAPAERTEKAGVVVVSESVARQLWPTGNGVGQVLRGVYLPTGLESSGTWLCVRVRGNLDRVRLALLERLTGLDPVFGIMTLGNGMQTALLQIGFGLTLVLRGLALVLTVSGLFSVLSYLVEQQAKDIGVRMALGAAALNVVRLVLS
jgi:hypothetical protein